MKKPSEISGQCLCGAVTVTATPINHSITACHCTQCRRWSGGPFMGVICDNHIAFEGDMIHFTTPSKIERGNCRHCGTCLFYYRPQLGQTVVSVNLFQAIEDYQFTDQIYIDHKPEYYDFNNQTDNLTGEEIDAYLNEENSIQDTVIGYNHLQTLKIVDKR